MAKTNERCGAGEPPWEEHVALLPLRFNDTTVKAGRPVLMTNAADEADQKGLYEALLRVDWLTPEIRRAVLKALGREQRAENVKFGRGRTLALCHLVDETGARMRNNGERPPKGDIRTAAIEEIAEKAGIEPDALNKRIQRLPKDSI
ncbi:MAG: hypothetical protein WAM72_24575 [Xanthobacteraceae bacterium]